YAAGSQSVLRGGIFASGDGGSSWSPRSAGVSGFLSDGVASDHSSDGTAVCVSGADVLRTNDQGATWSLVGTSSYFLFLLLGDPGDSSTFYAGYGPGVGTNGVLKSADGGLTWNPATNGFSSSNLHRLAI